MAALGFGRFSYTMLLPATRDGLGLTYTSAGFLATANLAGYLVGSLLSGTVANRIGPRRTAILSLMVLAFGLAWTGASQRVEDAAAARALAGVAGGVLYVQALGLVAMWFPGRSKGLASGLMHSGNGAGLLITGLALPAVINAITTDGWRVAWITLAAATLAILPCAWAYFRYPSEADAVVIPATRDTPVVVHEPSLSAYAGLYGVFGLSYIVYVTFFAETLRTRGLPLTQTGVAWAVIGTLSLISGPAWGALSDRIGRMEGIGLVFVLQGLAYLAFISAGPWGLVTSAAVFGLTAWGIPAVMAAAMSDCGRAGEAMIAFGRITTVMGIGQAAGPMLAGVTADLTGAVNTGLWISIVSAFAGGIWAFGEAGLRSSTPTASSGRSKA